MPVRIRNEELSKNYRPYNEFPSKFTIVTSFRVPFVHVYLTNCTNKPREEVITVYGCWTRKKCILLVIVVF